MTFDELQNLIRTYDYVAFKDIWGHRDEKKYNTLSDLVSAILKLKEDDPSLGDYDLMSSWAKQANISNRKKDSIGKIKNVGIATFQHFRLTFGVDTVKPDQRIMEVLDTEIRRSDFEEILSSSLKLTPSAAICMIHKIAKIAEKPVALTDQIFVKYGSGYYLKN